MTDDKVLISEIKKGANEVVRVQISEFRGQHYLDLRCWYFPDARSTSDQLLPTKKGISLHTEVIDELLKAIQEARAYIRSMYSGKGADAGPTVDFPEETAKDED